MLRPRERGVYSYTRTIAKNQMHRMYRARDTFARVDVACKVIILPEDGLLPFEIAATARLQHPNVVTIHDFFAGPSTGEVTLVTRWVHGGYDVLDEVKRGPVSVRRAKRYIRCLARALVHFHARGFLHLDIKPENCLVDGSALYVCDLEAGDWFRERPVVPGEDKRRGTIRYASPEMILGRECTPGTDVWGLGHVLYVLLAPKGYAFGAGEDPRAHADRVAACAYTDPDGVDDSAALDLMRAIFVSDPAARPSAKEVLAHPFCAEVTPPLGEPIH